MPRPPPRSTCSRGMPSASMRSASANSFSAASTHAPRSVICDPMWQSMPRTAIPGNATARRYSGNASAYAMPNLLCLRPVEMYGCVRVELGSRFDVEAQDAGGERGFHFGGALADAGEHDLRRIAARRDHAGELARRHNVESAAEARERGQHAEVRVRFHRVAHKMRHAVECGVVGAIRRLDR